MQPTRHDLKSIAARILQGAESDEAVVLAWPLACGASVAERTQALTFQNGTLSVLVPDEGWKAQLAAFSAHYSQQLSKLSGTNVNAISYEVKHSASSDRRF